MGNSCAVCTSFEVCGKGDADNYLTCHSVPLFLTGDKCFTVKPAMAYSNMHLIFWLVY